MWERACSRMQSVSQPIRQLTHRFREQARSHRGLAVAFSSAGHKSNRPHGFKTSTASRWQTSTPHAPAPRGSSASERADDE
ncbi:hypothetical protein EJJ20_27495 [Pseudomonas poae]|nr:hypothetical protein EJJ20_27495 [Pseudomonas poae]